MTAPGPGLVRVVVPRPLAGERVDRFVAAATDLSRRAARRLAGEGRLLRNGRVVRVLSRTLQTGDVVDILVDGESLRPTLDPPPPVELLHEDPWLVAAHKPAGVLSQASEAMGRDESPLDERVLLHLALREGRRPFLRLVHRLDRLTSGVLLFARSPAALAPLAEAWRSGSVRRLYLAVVLGRVPPRPVVLDEPIARDPGHRWRFRTGPGGRPARTTVHPLVEGPGDTTVVACLLSTGRTHQVRVHLAGWGHPVAGDRLYGGSMAGVGRPMLHAALLHLPHPRCHEPLEITAPVPGDMARLLPEPFPEHRWRELVNDV